ncbi:MAG: LysM domain-containing protein, partial [Prevotella sp.]|nr:LysM domain-containing protein [Prevotella sp.]
IVYLEKKRTKADKSFKRRPHIVRAGESMYSIAQTYGVRLKSLYKKNNMSPDHSIHVGDKIRVY